MRLEVKFFFYCCCCCCCCWTLNWIWPHHWKISTHPRHCNYSDRIERITVIDTRHLSIQYFRYHPIEINKKKFFLSFFLYLKILSEIFKRRKRFSIGIFFFSTNLKPKKRRRGETLKVDWVHCCGCTIPNMVAFGSSKEPPEPPEKPHWFHQFNPQRPVKQLL